ncbi:hypothetical protein H2200_001299 [Cladophialophora chaetospira]|uniref:Zn(2)-C6 fungal-type domain-containing protein n=1 Tax=Cladophialophora chaetospira TaxID=386627 RepID=A0AA38XKW6_9EURO|nr:hypothetical protein H2200_001299 [Cladophialophora chaetospira]
MTDEKSLSRYACDYCWKKKLRCSREKPKCKNCSFWTSGCVYSRDSDESKRSPTKTTSITEPQQQQVTPSGSNLFTSQPPSVNLQNDGVPEFGNEVDTSISSTPYHTQHVLRRNQTRRDFGDLTIGSASMLSELYKDFNHSTYDHDNIKAAVRKMRREGEPFFVPAEPVGHTFLQCFLGVIAKGFPLLGQPSEDKLYDLVFNPSLIEERGWVLMFNTILATASTQAPQLSEYIFQLQWNTWLAAEEASLYTEASILNIQALTVFATHAQDLVTPSLCWNLMGHSCRMAQTIKLHLTLRSTSTSNEIETRNVCLFWSLFIIDKILSLSFGCPPSLPTSLYRNVTLPSSQQLSGYRPHLSNADLSSGLPPHVELFGAFYFVQCTKLAIIMGDISDYFLLNEHHHGYHLELKKKLDQWISVVRQNQSAHGNLTDTTDPARVSVRLGYTYLTYQYHHLVVCLTRGNKSCREVCLNSARAAIALLKGLVAHSEEVFNSTVWQQLYMPFTPFFVLFGEVITNPTSRTNVDDLQLLRQTVLYFLEFQRYHASAVKLEKVAETFTKIAEAYVRHVFRKQSSIGGVENFRAAKQLVSAGTLTDTITPIDGPPPQAMQTTAPDLDSAPGVSDQMDYMLRLDETNTLNPGSLLQLFSYHEDDAALLEQSDITESELESMRGLQHPLLARSSQQAIGQAAESGQYVSMRDVEMNGKYQFSNCTFDWFALENYNI